MNVQPVNEELLHSLPLPSTEADTDKNSRGSVLVVGGSTTSPGAVVLSGLAAFRSGAGKVLLCVPERIALAMSIGFPEAGIHSFACAENGNPAVRDAAKQIAALLSGIDVALIGPGLMDASTAQELARAVLDQDTQAGYVIDALAMTGLWDAAKPVAKHRDRIVITPNAAEMALLTGASRKEVDSEPLRFAQEAAAHLGCVVVLKGTSTVIALPAGPCYLHTADIAGLAMSGSGDVLAGMLATLMARGATCPVAALWSVHLHAQAGRCLSKRIGPLGFLARELPAEIPRLMCSSSRSSAEPERHAGAA